MPAPNSLPIADLSMYLMHGGPRVEDLFGGVLNGEFVRGGRLWNVLRSKEELANLTGRTIASMSDASVLQSGTDVSQSQDLLNAYRRQVDTLTNPNSPAEKVTAARSWIERNKDIVSGVLSGQVHMTGIQPTIHAGNTAYEYGGIHLIKVPKNLNPSDRLAEVGQSSAAGFKEVPFWGQHQPIASVAASHVDTLKKTKMEKYGPLVDEMINDANRNLSPEQKAAYRASQADFGNQITPAQRAFIINEFKLTAQNAGIALNAQDENGFMLFDSSNKPVKAVGGVEDTLSALERATTKEEMIQAVRSATRSRVMKNSRTQSSRKCRHCVQSRNL